MSRRPRGTTLLFERLPKFPRPFVRLPVFCRITPDYGYWVAGVGRIRIEWQRGEE